MLGLDNNSNLRDISVQSHLFYSKEQTHPDAQFRYGLVVRQSGENYYAFVINPRLKRWSVLRHGAEGMTELLQGVDAGMVTLETDAGRNMLRVDASGSTFAFAINGHLVTHFTDPDARLVGATGFFVESLNDQLSHIHVEELVVSRLPAEAIPGPSVQELANQQMELTVAENTPIPEPVALPGNPSSLGMERVEAASYPLGTDGETVTLDEFWIDRYEVTNAQYAQFIAATSLPAPSYWGNGNVPAGNEEYPVREVNWDSAKAYCTWAQKRLPTETEWEVAARGPFGWSYPWGRDGAIVSSSRLGGMHQVGMLLADRSYFGVYDMGGNVWEWVDEPFHPLPSGQRMLRGGSYSFPKTMTEFVTGDSNSEMLMQDAGFRCAASTVAFEPETLLPPSDQFQDVHSGWPQSIGDQPEYFYGYHPSDFYHLQVTVPNDCLTVVRDAPSANVMVEARIFVLASKDANGKSYQGITLRATDDRFYGFLVEPRLGVWRVERQSEEGTALIDSGSSVSIGGTDQITADRLLVVADGPTFLFFVNGELVSQIRDEAYREGGIGLIVKNGSQSYSHVHFDEIRVWEISPQMETGVAQWTESSAQISQTACRGRVRQDDLLGNFTVVRLDAQERPGVAVDIRELLSKQAAELGISVEELLKANSKTVDEIETVKIGDELIVPVMTSTP